MSLTPKEARELWASELESGKWKQGTGQLARETDHGTEYCCLGVACELAVREGIIESYTGRDTSLWKPYAGVRTWLGLMTGDGDYGDRCLTNDNDEGRSFVEIADTVRNPPKGLVSA